MHQGGNSVESVQQKMRMHLHSQYLQAGLGQPGLQLCGTALPLPIFLEITKRMSHPRQGPAKKQVAEKESLQAHPHETAKRSSIGPRTKDEVTDEAVLSEFYNVAVYRGT